MVKSTKEGSTYSSQPTGANPSPLNSRLSQLNQSYNQYAQYIQYQQMLRQMQQQQQTTPPALFPGEEEAEEELEEEKDEDYIISVSPAEFYRRLLSLDTRAPPYRGKKDVLVSRVVTLQAFTRGWLVRKRLLLRSILERAATFIEAVFRGFRTRKRMVPVLTQVHRLLNLAHKRIHSNKEKEKETKLREDVEQKEKEVRERESNEKEEKIKIEEAKREKMEKEKLDKESQPTLPLVANPLEHKVNKLEEMNQKMREKIDQQNELMLNFLTNQSMTQISASNKLLSELKDEISTLKENSRIQERDRHVVNSNNNIGRDSIPSHQYSSISAISRFISVTSYASVK